VWLYRRRGEPELPIHASYRDTAGDAIPLSSTKCRVVPHICLLRTTQTLLLRNTDPIGDGLKIDSLRNLSINILLPPDGEKGVTFPNPERSPIRVSCPIHPWETGWLLVSGHPYMAVSSKDGQFEIRNLPCGTWTFQIWHEVVGSVQEVTIDHRPQSWRRGRTEIDIAPGTNDLGEVILAPTLFGK
jgi:hypothetical protein